MYRNTLLSVLLLLAVAYASGKYVASITVDLPSGQVLVLESTTNPILYEVDNVALTQNAAHHIKDQASTSPVTNSLFIKKKSGSQRVLLAGFDSQGLTVDAFKLPIGNQQTLPYIDTGIVGDKGASATPFYDTASNLALYSPSRNITLVNTNTIDVLDSFRYWGTRIAGRNTVINNNNKHLIIFYTAVKYYPNPYGLSVDEFDLATGKLVETTTTYNCLCETNPEQSPFFKVIFAEQKCALNYATNSIWCYDVDNARLFSFTSNNLSNFKYWNITTPFSNLVWDFANNRAYALYEQASGFSVFAISLATGAVTGTPKSVSGVTIDSYVTALDADQNQLYVAAFPDGGDESLPTAFVSINTNTYTTKTITLTSNGYFN